MGYLEEYMSHKKVIDFDQRVGNCNAYANSWCAMKLAGHSDSQIIYYFDSNRERFVFEQDINTKKSMFKKAMNFSVHGYRKKPNGHTSYKSFFREDSKLFSYKNKLNSSFLTDWLWEDEAKLDFFIKNKIHRLPLSDQTSFLNKAVVRLIELGENLLLDEPKAMILGFRFFMFKREDPDQFDVAGHAIGVYMKKETQNVRGADLPVLNLLFFDPNFGVYKGYTLRDMASDIFFVFVKNTLYGYDWHQEAAKKYSLPHICAGISFEHMAAVKVQSTSKTQKLNEEFQRFEKER